MRPLQNYFGHLLLLVLTFEKQLLNCLQVRIVDLYRTKRCRSGSRRAIPSSWTVRIRHVCWGATWRRLNPRVTGRVQRSFVVMMAIQ